jgi:hypothetical protein
MRDHCTSKHTRIHIGLHFVRESFCTLWSVKNLVMLADRLALYMRGQGQGTSLFRPQILSRYRCTSNLHLTRDLKTLPAIN